MITCSLCEKEIHNTEEAYVGIRNKLLIHKICFKNAIRAIAVLAESAFINSRKDTKENDNQKL